MVVFSNKTKRVKITPRVGLGEWDSNPRVLSNMGLAIPRPTRLGDPRSKIVLVRIYYCLKNKDILIYYILLG